MAPTQHFGEVSCVDVNSNVISPLEKTSFSSPVVVGDNCISSTSGNVLPNASSNKNFLTNSKTINETSQKAKDISNLPDFDINISTDNVKDITCEVSENLFSKQKDSSSFTARLRDKRKRRRRLNCDIGASNTSPTANSNINSLQNVSNCSSQFDNKGSNSKLIENSESYGLQSASENSHAITSQPESSLSQSQYKSSSPSTSSCESVSSRNSENDNSEACCKVIEIGISHKTQPSQNVPMLPIKRRTRRYMVDPCFEDALKHLEEAAKEVLDTYGQMSDHQDYFKAYRKLRVVNSDVKEAVAIFQSDEAHTVVLDAQDFARGSMIIKMVNEDELVVAGCVRKMTTGSPGTGTQYQRRFKFPVPVTAAKAFISADGVLHITIPKHEQYESQTDCISQSRSSSTNDSPSSYDTLLNITVSAKTIVTSGSSKKSECMEGTAECRNDANHSMGNPVFNKGTEETSSSSKERIPYLPEESSPGTGDSTTPPSSDSTQPETTEQNDERVTTLITTQSMKSRANYKRTSLSVSKVLPKELRQKHEENVLAMVVIAKHVLCYLLLLWMSAILMRSLSHVSVVI